MNIFKKLFFGVAGVAMMGSFASCSDDVTLDGADAVYIDITPSSLSLKVGDRQRISARVTNEEGKVIETPVTWSIDDETVARLVPVYRPVEPAPTPDPGPAEGEGEGEGGEGGDAGDDTGNTPAAAAAAGEGEGEGGDPVIPSEPEEEQGEFLYYAVEPVAGAQGKSTYLRVQLENGKQAIAPISIVRGDLDGALTPITEIKRSFQRQSDDTVYFKLSYPGIVDDYVLSYECIVDEESILDYTYDYNSPANGSQIVETKPLRPGDEVFTRVFHEVHTDTLCIIYTAPRMAAKAVCRVTLTNPDPEMGQSFSAEAPIYVLPDLSPGFEVNGKRPLAGKPNPSNIKQTLLFQTIDINSTFDLGLCIGVEGGWVEDICRGIAAHDAGWFSWKVDGSSVVVENEYIDTDYKDGFVPYIRLHAGSREGLSVITYYTPFWTCVCNLEVKNYNVAYPVDEIVTYDALFNPTDEFTFQFGSWPSMNIKVFPESSFDYHIPTIEIADETILTQRPRAQEDGYAYNFELHKEGTTVITIKSLDKVKTVTVHVVDVVTSLFWGQVPTDAVVGSPFELPITARLGSGGINTRPITWTCDHPELVTFAAKDGDPNTLVVNPLAAGEVTFTASIDGVTSSPVTVIINAAQDLTFGEGTEWYVSIAEGYFYLFPADDTTTDDFTFYTEIEPDNFDGIPGHYTGSDGDANFTGSFSGCVYDLTITYVTGSYNDGDLEFSLTGTITLPNGSKVIFNNVTLYSGD